MHPAARQSLIEAVRAQYRLDWDGIHGLLSLARRAAAPNAAVAHRNRKGWAAKKSSDEWRAIMWRPSKKMFKKID